MALQTVTKRKKSDTYFKPGNPGGPGRPHESKSDRELRELIREAAPDLIKALIAKGRKGAHNPVNILLKKILPDMTAMVLEDRREKEVIDDVSGLPEEQRRAIKEHEKEIERIKHGADGNKTLA